MEQKHINYDEKQDLRRLIEKYIINMPALSGTKNSHFLKRLLANLTSKRNNFDITKT